MEDARLSATPSTAWWSPPCDVAPSVDEPTIAVRTIGPPELHAVYQRRAIHLRGSLPSRAVADALVERFARVVGLDQVFAGHTLDPDAPIPDRFPLFAGASELYAPGLSRATAELAHLLELLVALQRVASRVRIELSGHLGHVIGANDPERLAQERMNAVRAFLEFRGADMDRIVGLHLPVATLIERAGPKRLTLVLHGLLS
jgi:hypothetical protein